MQVFSLPRQVIRSARAASRLGDGKVDAALESRRDAVRRWRRAMSEGLSALAAADAVGVPLPHRLQQLNPLIDAFAHHYNHHRPHDALDSLSPIQYLHAQSFGLPPPSPMS